MICIGKNEFSSRFHFLFRSSTPSNRINIVKTSTQRQDDVESERGLQYRSRVCSMKTPPPAMLNGSIYDKLSQNIWDEYNKRRQPHEVYEKKTYLWSYLNEKLKVWKFITFFTHSNKFEKKLQMVQQFTLTDGSAPIESIFGGFDDIWIRIRLIGRRHVSCVPTENINGATRWSCLSIGSCQESSATGWT